jgi:hypothetical protein
MSLTIPAHHLNIMGYVSVITDEEFRITDLLTSTPRLNQN